MRSMPLSVFVASADLIALDVYRRLFYFCGHEVETASSGLECLTKLQEFAPDVLVLDDNLKWSGADGVLGRIRENERTFFTMTPVILIQSDTSPACQAEQGLPP